MLYLANISELTCDFLETMVCRERIEYASRYRFEIDRRRSLAVEALLNVALKREGYEGDFPVRVGHEENWKPYFIDDVSLPGMDKVYFSLSHSGDYVAVAISDSPIGIDIEEVKGHKNLIEEKYFSDEERRLMNEDPDGSDVGFFRLWTLKEAFLKAVGQGLSYGIEGIRVKKSTDVGHQIVFGIDLLRTNLSEKEMNYKVINNYEYCDYSYIGLGFVSPPGYAISVCICIENIMK